MKISQHIKELQSYIPGKPIAEVKRELGLDKVYKLASNENPLGLSPMAKAAMLRVFDEISQYPDAACYELAKGVSKYYGVDSKQVAFGNGSEEVIDLVIRTFCEPKDRVLTSRHTFPVYKLSSQAQNLTVIEVSMDKDLKYDLSGFKKELEKNGDSIRIIFIANPNNPTGTYTSNRELGEFLDYTSRFENLLVVVDEAYNEFVRAKDYPLTNDWINKYKNLLLIRTFSKVYGLAGIRLGILLGSSELLEYYNRVRKPFNVNSLAQVAGLAALEDRDFLRASQKLNWEGLDYYYREFKMMDLKYYPSQANFVLVELPLPADEVFKKMLQKGVITRPVANFGLPNHLRISVGLPEENQAAIVALKDILNK
jgi:histidinol-phosphate aminotransferase